MNTWLFDVVFLLFTLVLAIEYQFTPEEIQITMEMLHNTPDSVLAEDFTEKERADIYKFTDNLFQNQILNNFVAKFYKIFPKESIEKMKRHPMNEISMNPEQEEAMTKAFDVDEMVTVHNILESIKKDPTLTKLILWARKRNFKYENSTRIIQTGYNHLFKPN